MDPQLPNYQQLALYVGKNFPVTILCNDTKELSIKLDPKLAVDLRIYLLLWVIWMMNSCEKNSQCQHFLSDSEMENGRHNVYNFKLAELDSQTINDKLERVFESRKCSAKINIALGFVLRNREKGQYCYFYAHENNTVFEKSHLLCTRGDLTRIQDKVKHCHLLEMCTWKAPTLYGNFACLPT